MRWLLPPLHLNLVVVSAALFVIDFDDGCHGITLLSAIQTCRPELPIIVVTSSDAYQAAAIVFANGVEACLAKPISAAELKIVIEELAEPKLQLVAADRPEVAQMMKIHHSALETIHNENLTI